MSQTLSQITVAPAVSDTGSLYLAAQPAANLGQRTNTVFATTALTFNPTTGALVLGASSTSISGPITVAGSGTFAGAVSTTSLTATNGLIYNGRTITQSTTIPVGYNAVSVGPITQANGVVVTQASGTRWVIL